MSNVFEGIFFHKANNYEYNFKSHTSIEIEWNFLKKFLSRFQNIFLEDFE